MAFLKGYKSYLIALCLVVVSLIHLLSGDITITQFLNSPDLLVLLNGLGIGALRAAID